MAELKNIRIAISGIYDYAFEELPSLKLPLPSTAAAPNMATKRIYKVYRPSVVLEAAKDKFKMLPLTYHHPKVPVDGKNFRQLTVGYTSENTFIDYITDKNEVGIRSNVMLYDDEIIAAYNRGEIQLSPGYLGTFEWQSGTSPNGQSYDIIMKEITAVNHLALLPDGRGGAEAIILDKATEVKTVFDIVRATLPVLDADFDESKHKRDSDGKFTSGGSGSKNAQQDKKKELQKEQEEVRTKYKGTDKWLKAPNGKESKLSEEQWISTRTESFKSWFGDWENDPENASKVVDENGEPRVVYHGGDTPIDDFSRGARRGYLGKAYFSKDEETAQKYAYLGGIDKDYDELDDYKNVFERATKKGDIKRDPNVTETFLDIKNPLDIERVSFNDVIDVLGKDYIINKVSDDTSLLEILEEKETTAEEYLDDHLEEYLTDVYGNYEYEDWSHAISNDLDSFFSEEDNWLTPSNAFLFLLWMGDVEEYQEAIGRDGIIYFDNESLDTVYVPRDSSQIKSSKSNNSFSNSSSNIYDSKFKENNIRRDNDGKFASKEGKKEKKGGLKTLSKTELKDFIRKHRTSKENLRVSLGDISVAAKEKIQAKTGIVVKRVILDSDSIRHAFNKKHHNLEEDDLDDMFDVINTTNDIELSEETYKGNKVIVFRKEEPNGKYLLEEFRSKKGDLELVTAYRIKKQLPQHNAAKSSPGNNVQNGAVPSPNITHDGEHVKSIFSLIRDTKYSIFTLTKMTINIRDL